MPNSTDNQDYSENHVKNEDKKSSGTETATGPAMGDLPLSTKKDNESTSNEDENNFDSDDQKGKKVDADPDKESDKPGKQ